MRERQRDSDRDRRTRSYTPPHTHSKRGKEGENENILSWFTNLPTTTPANSTDRETDVQSWASDC